MLRSGFATMQGSVSRPVLLIQSDMILRLFNNGKDRKQQTNFFLFSRLSPRPKNTKRSCLRSHYLNLMVVNSVLLSQRGIDCLLHQPTHCVHPKYRQQQNQGANLPKTQFFGVFFLLQIFKTFFQGPAKEHHSNVSGSLPIARIPAEQENISSDVYFLTCRGNTAKQRQKPDAASGV